MAQKNIKDLNHIGFVNPLEAGYKCKICNLGLASPFQTVCGHRYCEACILDVITSGSKTCPEDGTALSMEQINRDAFCEREIKNLECYCSNKGDGCNWTGPLKFLEDHESICPKFVLACPKGCRARLSRSQLENHFAQDCPHANASCPMAGQCDFQGSRLELRKHLAEKNVEHTSMFKDTTTDIQQQQEVVQEEVANQREELATVRHDLATLCARVSRQEQRAQHPSSRCPQEPDADREL